MGARTRHDVLERNAARIGDRHHIAPLTGLRFGAALFVVLHHLDVAGLIGMHTPITSILRQGEVAVSMFFVLSGFVLIHVYRENPPNTAGSRRGFYAARIARIYPLYLVGLALSPTAAPDGLPVTLDCHSSRRLYVFPRHRTPSRRGMCS